MIKAFEEIKIKPISWAIAGLYCILIGIVYHSALKTMLRGWGHEDYSHCALIPFVMLYFIWEKRKTLSDMPSVPSYTGFVPFLLGTGLYWIGELGGEFYTQYLSIWLLVIGLFWLHNGWDKIKVMSFPFILMFFMFPFPSFISVRISFMLQLISSKIGVFMLQLYGMTAYREGNVIDIGYTQLQVVEACSGLRYIMPLMILSLILAYWFKEHMWKRVFLFASSIPLAIVMNSFRIAVTGILYSILGPKVAEAFFHGFSGWLIFLVAVPMLMGEMWVLKKLSFAKSKAQQNEKIEDEMKEEVTVSITPSSNRGFFQPVFLVSVIILISTFVFSQGVEFREKVPIKKPLDHFPLTVGEWSARTTEELEEKFLKALKLSDYIMADYKNAAGKEVNFYVAYYESQRKGESIHSPETCLPGSGWDFQNEGTVTVAVTNNPFSVKINRAYMVKPGAQQVTYFWFSLRGRTVTHLWQVKLYNFWDALTRQRTDGALIRLVTPLYPSESLEDADRRLKDFMKKTLPVLEEFLPGKS